VQAELVKHRLCISGSSSATWQEGVQKMMKAGAHIILFLVLAVSGDLQRMPCTPQNRGLIIEGLILHSGIVRKCNLRLQSEERMVRVLGVEPLGA